MKRIPLCCFSFVLMMGLTACSNKKEQERNDKLLKIMEEGLIASNDKLDDNRYKIFKDVERKMADPASHDLMSIWEPRIVRLDKLSDSLIKFIFSLRDSLYAPESTMKNISKQQAGEIYRRLLAYKKSVFEIDSSIANEFASYKSFVLTTASFDSTAKTSKDFYKMFFANNSTAANSAMLFRLMNNVKHRQVEVMDYLNRRMVFDVFIYDQYQAIVSQNATNVRANEKVEVYAGVGAFTSNTTPEITLNGKYKAHKTPEGAYLISFNAPSKPGTYTSTVKMSFLGMDKQMKTFERKITYYVDSIPSKE